MKLSVVIPCFSEAPTIESIVAAVRDSSYAPKEIVVVNDCSNDGTHEILEKLKARGWIDHLLRHESTKARVRPSGPAFSGRPATW